jgi:hypothetical protein
MTVFPKIGGCCNKGKATAPDFLYEETIAGQRKASKREKKGTTK